MLPMRVCVLTPFLDVYKGGNHLPLFAALPAIQFKVLTARVIPEGAALPANVSVEHIAVRPGSYYFGLADWRFARAVLQTYPPDHSFWKQFGIIHLNQVLGPQFVRLRGTGVPVLYAIHHPVIADREVAMAETEGLKRLLWRLKYALPVRWQRYLCRRLPHMMTVSATVRQKLIHDYALPAEKIAVVPNGVDGERFHAAEQPVPEFGVVALGSFIHPRKGFEYLLGVYRSLAQQGVRIADVGKRSPEQRQALTQITGVTCLGTVSDAEIPPLLRRSAVLLSTALYEGFGLSLIEALACGRPAFAFDAGAVREVLAPIDPELIVAPRDVDALTARVLAFLALPAHERLERGRRYREAVLERYSNAAAAQALGVVYARLRRPVRDVPAARLY